VSADDIPNDSAETSSFELKLLFVSTTPLGSPVVPDV